MSDSIFLIHLGGKLEARLGAHVPFLYALAPVLGGIGDRMPRGRALLLAHFAVALFVGVITLLRYDPRARKADEPRDLYRSPSGTYAGWPFVLPDDRGVILTLGSSPR